MLSSTQFDISNYLYTQGGDVLCDVVDAVAALDEGLDEFDDGLEDGHSTDYRTCLVKDDPRFDRIFPSPINVLGKDSQETPAFYGFMICATACLCTNRLTLKCLTDSSVFMTMGSLALTMPLDVEWTLLEGWGYTAPLDHNDIHQDVYNEWEHLHVDQASTRVLDAACFGDTNDPVYCADERCRTQEAKTIGKSKATHKLWWPLLSDRLIFREGMWGDLTVFQRPKFRISGSLFDGDASVILSARHVYCNFGVENQRRVVELCDNCTSRPTLTCQHQTLTNVGPSLSAPSHFHGQVFMVRVAICPTADDCITKPNLVSLTLEMQDGEEMYFSADKALTPKWVDALIDAHDPMSVYYFHVDETFDGNLDKLWSGESKTISMSKRRPIFHIELDTDDEVTVSIVAVNLNGVKQMEGLIGNMIAF